MTEQSPENNPAIDINVEGADGSGENKISRREALERLAKLSVYSAPTVTTLMSAQVSYAASSIAPGNNNCFGSGAHTAPGEDNPNSNGFNGHMGGARDWPMGMSNGFFGDLWMVVNNPGDVTGGGNSAADC